MPSWHREHLGGKVVALAVWVMGKCDASVFDDPKEHRVPFRVPCDTEEAAKAKADELLIGAYPHDCNKEACAPWGKFGGTA